MGLALGAISAIGDGTLDLDLGGSPLPRTVTLPDESTSSIVVISSFTVASSVNRSGGLSSAHPPRAPAATAVTAAASAARASLSIGFPFATGGGDGIRSSSLKIPRRRLCRHGGRPPQGLAIR